MLRRYLSAGRHSLRKDLVLTFTSNGIVSVLAMVLYAALMGLLGMPHLAAKILSNGASFVMNYHVRRKYF